MSDKTVRYSLEADASGAKKGMKSIVTEAKKAEKSTEKYGKKGKAAMNKVAMASKKTRGQYMALRRESANLDRLTGELSSAFAMVSPELASAASAASAVSGGFEGIARIGTALNGPLLLIIGTVGALAAAYQFMTKASRDAEEAAKKLKKAHDDLLTSAAKAAQAQIKLSESLAAVDERSIKSIRKIEDLRLQIQALQGDAEKADLMDIGRSRKKEDFEKQILKNKKDELALIEKQNGAIFTQIKALKATSSPLTSNQKIKLEDLELKRKENVEQMRTIRSQLSIYEQSGKILVTGKAINGDLKVMNEYFDKNREYVFETNEGQKTHRGMIVQQNDAIREQAEEYAQLLAMRDKELARQKRIQEAIKRRKRLEKDLIREIGEQIKELEKIDGILSKTFELNRRLQDQEIKNEADLLKARADRMKSEAEVLKGKERENKLAAASILLENARTKEIELQTKEIDREIETIKQQRAEAEKTLATAKENLKTLEKRVAKNKRMKDAKKEIKQAIEDIAIAESKLLQIQLQEMPAIMRLEKQKTDIGLAGIEKKRKAEAIAAKKRIADFEASRKLFETEMISKIKLKIKADIEKFSVPIEKVGQAISDISSPGGLPRLIGEKIGTFLAKFVDALPAVGGAIGGAVGGVLQGLAALGSKTPQEIEQEFRNFSRAVIMGLKILPSLLVKILPSFTVQLVGALAQAIPLLILELGVLLIDAGKKIVDYFTGKETRDKFAKDPAQFFKDAIESYAGFFGIGSRRSGGRIPSGRSGLRMTSGSFGGGGLAMLHPNEFVIPASGMRPQQVDRTLDQMGGASGGVSIVINSMMTEGSAVDALVRKIENRFQTFGSAKSPLFG